MRSRILLLLIVLSGCVGCDQVSKRAASEWLSGQERLSYLSDTVRLSYAENRGAFLGFGANWGEPLRWWAFTILSSLLVLGALLYAIRQAAQSRREWRSPLALALIAAGGIGNLIDRIVRDGAVIDFMNLGIGSLRTGIFNVADVQIMLGFGLLLVWTPRDHDAGIPTAHPPDN
jgi:signal peptidase II